MNRAVSIHYKKLVAATFLVISSNAIQAQAFYANGGISFGSSRDAFKRKEIGFNFLARYEYKNLLFTAQYSMAATKLFNNNRFNNLALTVGYQF